MKTPYTYCFICAALILLAGCKSDSHSDEIQHDTVASIAYSHTEFGENMNVLAMRYTDRTDVHIHSHYAGYTHIIGTAKDSKWAEDLARRFLDIKDISKYYFPVGGDRGRYYYILSVSHLDQEQDGGYYIEVGKEPEHFLEWLKDYKKAIIAAEQVEASDS